VPLGDYSSARWATLRRDIDDFAASPWSAQAAALGWSELDLFGVHATRPSVRPDQAGLVVLLDSCKIVELSANGAILETPAGAGRAASRDRRRGAEAGHRHVPDLGRRHDIHVVTRGSRHGVAFCRDEIGSALRNGVPWGRGPDDCA
jgi:hypothetical protein